MTAEEAKRIACDFVRSRGGDWSMILTVRRTEAGEDAKHIKDPSGVLANHSAYWIVGFEPPSDPNDDAVHCGTHFGVCVIESTGAAMTDDEHGDYMLSGRNDLG